MTHTEGAPTTAGAAAPTPNLARRRMRMLLLVTLSSLVGVAIGMAWVTYGGRSPFSGVRLRPVSKPEPMYGVWEPRMAQQIGTRTDTPASYAEARAMIEEREALRRSLQRALDQPWANYCKIEGRHQISGSINAYFIRRNSQHNLYVAYWGREGREYIENAWRRAGHLRIFDTLRDQYARGYLSLDHVLPPVRAEVLALIGDVKPHGKPCRR